ncbi:MAG: MFS transporter [Anaerolineaceae bacterium]|nr:MFS transporter [Anaerolineaceae bacterium]
MQKTFTRDAETWLTYLMLTFYGYLLNILGPLTPYLRDELNISYTIAGFHFSAFAVGMLISGLFGEQLQNRWGYNRTIWFSAFGMLLGSLVFLFARVVYLTIPGTFLMGLLGTTILSSVNARLSQKYKEQSAIALTEMNVMASFMAMCAPLLVGIFAPTLFGWRAAMMLALIALLVLAAVFMRPGTWEKVTPLVKSNTNIKRKSLPWVYWLYWAIAFMVVAVEFCFIFWGSDFLWTVVGLSRELAVLSLSLFIGAMLVGRTLGSVILRRVSARILLRSALGMVALGFVFFWTALTPWLAVVGLFIAGLGVANLYPTTISLALHCVPDELAAQASARSVLSSGGAILSLPLLLGGLADLFGMKPAFLVVPMLIALAFGLNLIVAREIDKKYAVIID